MKFLTLLGFLFFTNIAFGQTEQRDFFYIASNKQLVYCDSTFEIFTITEVMAEFPGGKNEMFKFIAENKKTCNSKGKVFVSVVIDATGSIHCAKVMRGISEQCNAEALRIIKSMPNWTPAMQNKEAVEMQYIIPVEF